MELSPGVLLVIVCGFEIVKLNSKTDMSNNSDSGLLGAVLLARHGDRQGFFQDPFTYTASQTQITALGSVS